MNTSPHYSARDTLNRPDNIAVDAQALADAIKSWGAELGFQQIAITDLALDAYRERFERWLADGRHGDMKYLERNVDLRFDPDPMVPGVCRAIVARMDYLPPDTEPVRVLQRGDLGYVSRYALGRDYHKVVRGRLRRIARRINEHAGGQLRAFTDSAPVLEKPLAEKAGLGWIGKHTLVLNKSAGSWFFLGEILTDLPLPMDAPDDEDHCGRCSACMTVCPTGAITAPRQLDARRCISYLTIEHKGAIPVALRPLVGNRIFGCDDCQLACPWNRYAKPSAEAEFLPRHSLDRAPLLDLFNWSNSEFAARTEGTALRRINYVQWQRNLAVAIGNAPHDPALVAALRSRRDSADPLVAEHIDWAIEQLTQKQRKVTGV